MKPVKVNAKVSGMHCASCVAAVENTVTKLNGVKSARVNLSTEDIFLTFDPSRVSIDKISEAIAKAGYKLIEKTSEKEFNEAKKREQKANKIRIITGFSIGVPLMVLMYIPFHMPIWTDYLIFLLSTPVFIYISWPIFKNALIALLNRALTMDVMYALGTGIAYIASVLGTFGVLLTHDFMFYETAIMLASFLTLGRFLETRARGRTSEAIKKLALMMPQEAWVEKNGEVIKSAINDIKIDDNIIIKPGERIPNDGIIIEGQSYIDESIATGESIPVIKKPGMKVIGGTLSKQALKVRVTAIGENTFLAQIIKLVAQAQTSKPPVQKLADRVVTYLIPLVLIIATLSFIFWYFLFGSSLLFALTRFISVLVVACPCALGLATPTAVTVGLGRGAELGILIKNSEVLELSEKVKTIVLDKTGTITSGRLAITDVKMDSNNPNKNNLFLLAASAEQYSEHPIADALVNEVKNQNANFFNIKDFQNFEGQGVRATIGTDQITVGNEQFMVSQKIKISNEIRHEAEILKSSGKTVIYVGKQDSCLGIIAFADQPKAESKTAVSELKKMNYDLWLLTGDNEITAKSIAQQVGIDKIRANVLPGEKARTISELQANGSKAIFVGDGINDAPALAQADIGIAMGKGTDIAIETGDIVLVRDNVVDIVSTLQLGKKVMQRIKQNIFWAFAYNIALIPLAAGLLFPIFKIDFKPEFAGLAMALSSITVVSLSLLLKKYTPPAKSRSLKGSD